MEVIAELQDGVLLVRMSGRIDSSSAAAFDRAVGAALEDNDRTVIMDLENLSYISSAGLRTFLKVARRLRGGTAELVLCAMSEETRKVFQITGFDRVISIYPTRAEAFACRARERAAAESTGARRME